MLGAAAGIAVPLVYSISHWLTAVVLMGVFILALLEGTYRVWDSTDQQRAALTSEAAQQPASASLDFELRGNGELFLFIRNEGSAEARKILIGGALDNGVFENIVGFPTTLQPNTERGVLINPSGYNIIAGHSRWDLEVSWEDGAGRHEKEEFIATRRTS
jgi:hypothetical protein